MRTLRSGRGVATAATALGLLAAALGLGGCRQPAPPPDILLVTIDTLRPDAMGWTGGRNETPTLDALAAAAMTFPQGATTVPITLPAHAAMLSGCYPHQFGLRDNGQVVPAGVELLSERLRGAGYATAAFVSGFPLKRMFGLDRGFDHYDDDMPAGREGYVERRARDTTRAAIAWLQESHPDRPRFVWVHYYDPHDPYEPPREFWQPGRRGAYDGEVAYTDHWLGELLAAWPGTGRERLTVVTSDHGEALGEHDEETHGYFVYDATVIAPQIWHWPGRIVAGSSSAQVSHTDLAATLLDLLEMPGPACGGTPLALDTTTRPSAAMVETYLPWNYFGWAPLHAVRAPPWKYIEAPQPELYHLGDDPGETHNLAGQRPQEVDRLRAELDRLRARPMVDQAGVAEGDVLAQLRGLGYIGIGQGTMTIPEGLADPKERIELRRRLIAADQKLAMGLVDAGLAELEAVMAVEPTNRFAALRAGTHLLKLGAAARAIPYLERAVANDGDRAEARFALADALTRVDRCGDALPQWLELARLQPRRVEAWTNLAHCHGVEGNREQAGAALERASELAPDDPAVLRLRAQPPIPPAG